MCVYPVIWNPCDFLEVAGYGNVGDLVYDGRVVQISQQGRSWEKKCLRMRINV